MLKFFLGVVAVMFKEANFKKLIEAIFSSEFNVVRVHVVPSRSLLVSSFSGVFIRELVLVNCSQLKKFNVFFRVSPLGVFKDGSVVFLWNRVMKGKASLVRIFSGRKYFMVFSGLASVCREFLNCIIGYGELRWNDVRFFISEIEVSNYKIPSDKPAVKLDGASYVKVAFRTPVLIADVFEDRVRYLPDPGYLFSRNVKEVFNLSNEEYVRLLNMFSAVLQETHNVWNTVRKVDCLFRDHIVSGLVGYVKYFVDWDFLKKHEGLKEILENVLTHAELSGVGLNREYGFGYVTIRTE